MNRRFFLKSVGGVVAGTAIGSVVNPIKSTKPDDLSKVNQMQLLMQLHDRGLVSTKTLLSEINLDYDAEVEVLVQENKEWFKSRNIQING